MSSQQPTEYRVLPFGARKDPEESLRNLFQIHLAKVKGANLSFEYLSGDDRNQAVRYLNGSFHGNQRIALLSSYKGGSNLVSDLDWLYMRVHFHNPNIILPSVIECDTLGSLEELTKQLPSAKYVHGTFLFPQSMMDVQRLHEDLYAHLIKPSRDMVVVRYPQRAKLRLHSSQ